jgi:hypothetical protein
METGSPNTAAVLKGQSFATYKPRTFAFLDLWHHGDWAFKVYGINPQPEHAPGQLINPKMVAAAKKMVTEHAEKLNPRSDHHHTGFVVIHEAFGGNWLLMRWWEQEIISCQILWESSESEPDRFMPPPDHFIACAFEMIVVEFERQAWIDTMLRDNGDREAYLATRLPDGIY